MSKVIVFGPTGNVGSVAAQTATKHGAKVVLAMRDPSKPIPGLSAEDEKSGGYERVQADLTQPATLTSAVQSTGATRAFIYLAFGAPEGMKASLQALKAAGVAFVVFLSSYTIRDAPDLAAIPAGELIPYVHARVEMSLDEVYGPKGYVAVRPGGFATNLLRYKPGITAGEVRVFGGAFKQDCITPGDMGRVSGTILANGPKNGQDKVYLYGPREWMQKDAFKEIGRVLGKEVKVVEMNEEQGREDFERNKVPKPFADYMIGHLRGVTEETESDKVRYEEGVNNVELYTGQKSMELGRWVEENKEMWT